MSFWDINEFVSSDVCNSIEIIKCHNSAYMCTCVYEKCVYISVYIRLQVLYQQMVRLIYLLYSLRRHFRQLQQNYSWLYRSICLSRLSAQFLGNLLQGSPGCFTTCIVDTIRCNLSYKCLSTVLMNDFSLNLQACWDRQLSQTSGWESVRTQMPWQPKQACFCFCCELCHTLTCWMSSDRHSLPRTERTKPSSLFAAIEPSIEEGWLFVAALQADEVADELVDVAIMYYMLWLTAWLSVLMSHMCWWVMLCVVQWPWRVYRAASRAEDGRFTGSVFSWSIGSSPQ